MADCPTPGKLGRIRQVIDSIEGIGIGQLIKNQCLAASDAALAGRAGRATTLSAATGALAFAWGGRSAGDPRLPLAVRPDHFFGEVR